MPNLPAMTIRILRVAECASGNGQETIAAHGGENAAMFRPNGIDNRRIVTRLQLTMKPLSMSLALLGGLMSLRGEDSHSKGFLVKT